MNHPVLLVIDMLNDFFQSGPLAERRSTLVHSLNELVALFRSREWPVVWIRQEFAPDLSDAFLGMRDQQKMITIAGTDGCHLLSELDYQVGDPVVVKKRYSAFFRTNLADLLASLQPDTLVLAGTNTHACVRTTAIDAYQRDFRVVIAAEAVASYDEEHHQITLRYLQQEIAQVLTNAELSAAAHSSNLAQQILGHPEP
ncbi:MAG TPA: isochorismatase family cysteine hydrolase [Pyrinomonadaceae bacterium]|nr:isochorismatase family cysteine hydrolase [Pyrinomonadaceae bacterium]